MLAQVYYNVTQNTGMEARSSGIKFTAWGCIIRPSGGRAGTVTVLSELSYSATWSNLSRPTTSKRGIGGLPAHLVTSDAVKRGIACVCSTSIDEGSAHPLCARYGPLAMAEKELFFNYRVPRQARYHLCRVVTCLRQWKAKLVDAGFQELVFEDAMEVVIDQLNSLGTAEPLQVAMLEENMRYASHLKFSCGAKRQEQVSCSCLPCWAGCIQVEMISECLLISRNAVLPQ